MAKKNDKSKGRALVPARMPEAEPVNESFRRFFNMPLLKWDWNSFNHLPSVDMVDEGKNIRITADIPGINKDKVKVNVSRNSVSIRAEGGKEQEKKGKNYYYRERSASGYYRNIPLPADVDEHSAKAKFSNGTLEITVSKKKQSGNQVKVE
jgi:HSP20 family molecular chaperone IbpA